MKKITSVGHGKLHTQTKEKLYIGYIATLLPLSFAMVTNDNQPMRISFTYENHTTDSKTFAC